MSDLTPTEDDAGDAWMAGIAREWHVELSDANDGIYSLNDGEPFADSQHSPTTDH